MTYFSNSTEILMTTEQIQRFQETSVVAAKTKYHESSSAKKKDKRQYLAPATRFNPNQYQLSDWMALGLSEKQSQAVLNFVKRGIYSNRSLQKIYALPQQAYHLLKDSTYYEIEQRSYESKEGQHSPEVKPLLEINSASRDELMGLSGIGVFYAKQIIKYRDELGGFRFKEQLLEVWKMRLETYEKVLPQIYFDTSKINKINLNSCSVEILKSHPYLDYYQANSVFKMRQQKGRYISFDELLESKLIDEEQYKRILPYLCLK